MSGRKDDSGKIRVDLVPVGAVIDAATVFGFGAAKYGARNWEQGIDTSRLYGAALRHLLAWQSGEDLDPESGEPHLSHALCSVMMLSETAKHLRARDDRPDGMGPPVDRDEAVEIDWWNDRLNVCVAEGYEYEAQSLTAADAIWLADRLRVAAVQLTAEGPDRRAAESLRRLQDTGRVHGPEISERMAYEQSQRIGGTATILGRLHRGM